MGYIGVDQRELKKTTKGPLNALNKWFKEQYNAGVPVIQFLVHVHFFAVFNKIRIGKIPKFYVIWRR